VHEGFARLAPRGLSFAAWMYHTKLGELAAAWRPDIETCIAAFGSERAMFESNFPVDKGSCGYAALWNVFERIAAGCSAAEKAALFAGTATKFSRFQ
jgi:L-fuconolactonase